MSLLGLGFGQKLGWKMKSGQTLGFEMGFIPTYPLPPISFQDYGVWLPPKLTLGILLLEPANVYLRSDIMLLELALLLLYSDILLLEPVPLLFLVFCYWILLFCHCAMLVLLFSVISFLHSDILPLEHCNLHFSHRVLTSCYWKLLFCYCVLTYCHWSIATCTFVIAFSNFDDIQFILVFWHGNMQFGMALSNVFYFSPKCNFLI